MKSLAIRNHQKCNNIKKQNGELNSVNEFLCIKDMI